MKVAQSLLLVSLAVTLVACDKLPFPDPNRAAMQKELDSKAIGGACRHAGRALEDCYRLNPKASKAAVFAGWREMNDYMTENKLDVVLPALPPRGTRMVGETAHAGTPSADSLQDTDKAGGDGASDEKKPDSSSAKPSDKKNPALTAG
ncbi:MAG: hypothetical protein ABIF28_16595 [Pseudomonadota bacterium]|uniref:hypothetical protein n=1 Tax=Methyloversatilis sp. TaxID=2569862 RepID=UPI002735DF34|nr:hypothetical protein [Methyloversatilis sp.]MDP3873052.1 hypothetical protein [Methyloversatilis sp.]